ncbi:VWA domain-containing protein [Oribacterium sp. FC2011]|uniref:VWA domain-containing protein n=1 Tax=Oribacterium sp. FC2011 TaxID=1408311 RepID=UPI0006788901|nr:VWA domain-containing protein [Oribacterium sp. FC2011]
MYCMKCGSEIKEDQSFCMKCGAKVEKIRYESTPSDVDSSARDSSKDDPTDDVQRGSGSESGLTEGNAEALRARPTEGIADALRPNPTEGNAEVLRPGPTEGNVDAFQSGPVYEEPGIYQQPGNYVQPGIYEEPGFNEYPDDMEEPEPASVKPKKSGNKALIALSVILVLSMLMVGGLLVYRQMPMVRYQRNIKVAQKYMLEGDYEQAILAIKEAIDIEPKKMDAYLLLADAFKEIGEEENAINTVEIALNYFPENKRLTEYLSELELSVETSEDVEDSDDEEDSGNIRKGSDTKKSGTVTTDDKTAVSAASEIDYDRLQKEIAQLMQGNMVYISSDVSQYPLVRVYFQINDANGNVQTLLSPTAAIRESISGGAFIEREIKKIEKLEGNQGISIDIVADKSGSMDSDINQVKSVMSQFVNSLDYTNGDRAELLAFEDSVMYMCSYTNNPVYLNNGILGMSAYGGTALYDAIYEAVTNSSGQAGAHCVIAFTDGQDNRSVFNYQQVVDYARAVSVPIYIIGAGSVDTQTLTYIADQTGGRYWNINDLYDMTEILNEIYSEQKDMYCLEYISQADADRYAPRSIESVVCDKDSNYGASTTTSFTPARVIDYGNHSSRYEVVLQDISWADANAAAIRKGGHLVTITSQDEMNQVSALCENAGIKYCWMGGYTMLDSSGCYGHWITGEDFNQYQAWYPGEPSRNDLDGTEEKYLMLWNIKGVWSWNDERIHPAGDLDLQYYRGKTGYVIEYEQ